MSTRERRVTLALKWHHLDNLSPQEVRDRFEEEGIGDYTVSTIRNYLNEEPAEEVLEQIENEHANVRLQSAERYERLYQEAGDDVDLATEDKAVKRVVPKMRRVKQQEGTIRVPNWEVIEPGDDDWPEHAEEGDLYIRFTDEEIIAEPGDQVPARNRIDGSPKYTTEFVGLEEVPKLSDRQRIRNEKAKYQREKGDVLGIYSTDINMNVDGELETTVELDSATAAAIREADLGEDVTDE